MQILHAIHEYVGRMYTIKTEANCRQGVLYVFQAADLKKNKESSFVGVYTYFHNNIDIIKDALVLRN